MKQSSASTLVILLFLQFYWVCPTIVKQNSSHPCQSCHPLVEGKVNVHLVPHSHDDVGWLKTFNEYYYDTADLNSRPNAGVQGIIDSVVKALRSNPNRRYIQVETAFFWKWWLHQTLKTKLEVINLVNNGQLEMTNGGWSMNDEATTNYQSIIDQFTWGFRILEDTVGQCGRPKIGWQIDPFGHSREHASLSKQFGFEGLVVGRIDYRDKKRRKAEKKLDFVWKSSDSLENSQIFTTMFPALYVSEPGFQFDTVRGNKITKRNLNYKIADFSEILKAYRRYYRTSNIMMPMGDDFSFQVAEWSFENIDKLIEGFKNHPIYNVFYSTPSCYIRAVKNEVASKSLVLEEKTDDFFPYATSVHNSWTGYFTSRPTLKRFERVGNNILQSAKQLTAFSRIRGVEYDESILDLRAAMGVLQHHDAITGTEKQAVAFDYAKMLHGAIKKAEEPVGTIIGNLLKKHPEAEIDLRFATCLLSNVSICESSQKNRFLVAVQNPLSRVVTHHVRLPVDGEGYRVTGPDGVEVYDVFDTIHSFDHLRKVGHVSQKELVFAARNLPPLGIKLYYVENTTTSNGYRPFRDISASNGAFGTQTNGFSIDRRTGKLTSVTIRGVGQNVTQDFLYYPTLFSGAYVFCPESDAQPITTQPFTSTKFARGNLVDECLQVINDEVSQIIRVYKNEDDAYVEFNWLVGNLHYDDRLGKEVITRFTVEDFSNDKIFYTDSNGRQQIKRELDKRGDYTYKPSDEPISSNYYPVTSKIVIKDEQKNLQVAVLNDRAQGGTSGDDGVIELMLHRRLKRDDGFGLDETLNEFEHGRGLYARGQHYLTFGSIAPAARKGASSAFEKDLAHRKLLAPWVLLADATSENFTLEDVQNLVNFKFEGLTRSLPDNVQILTLEPWKNSYLLRLEHVFEKNEDENLSKSVTVDLSDIFTLFNVTDVSEMSLGANQKLYRNQTADLRIVLDAMQIRTFLVVTDRNNKGGYYLGEDSYAGNNNYSSGSSRVVSASVLLIVLVLPLWN